MLTFTLACVKCTSHVTSLGWGGGDVNVHVNLRLSKSAIPCSPPTRSNGHVNPRLMRSIRVWQWRWMNSTTKGLMEVTGQALKNRMAMWVEKIARVFRHKFPVNYRSSLKNHFKIPGISKTILGNESAVALWRKRHFFSKRSKRWRGFPPGGMFLLIELRGPKTWQCQMRPWTLKGYFAPCTLHFSRDNRHDPTFGTKPIKTTGANLSILISLLMTDMLEANSFLDFGRWNLPPRIVPSKGIRVWNSQIRSGVGVGTQEHMLKTNLTMFSTDHTQLLWMWGGT